MTRLTLSDSGRDISSALAAMAFAAAISFAPAPARAQAACAATWNSGAVYTHGQAASVLAVNYMANWWTQGQDPSANNGPTGSAQPWTSTGACGAGTPVPPPPPPPNGGTCASAWSAAAVYTAGQVASLNGLDYTANWWVQNASPDTNSGPTGSGKPWTLTGSCSTVPVPPPPPPPPPGNPPPPNPVPPGATTHLFAPYVDLGLTVDQNVVSFQQQAGFKSVVLAFLDSTSGCAAGWGGIGGTLPTDTLANGTTVQSVVQSLQSAGVQVILSFGGASGTEPAVNCGSATQLQALYQSVLDRYKVKILDFDIEGGESANQAANLIRSQALAGLKTANPGLVIQYTLPVLPTGLVQDGLNILASAKQANLQLDTVNILAFDYGNAVDNNGNESLDAMLAAQATEKQIQAAGLSAGVGLTLMVGQNDTSTEVFHLADVQPVLNFASTTPYINFLSIWSLARDNGGCPAAGYASPTCSGVVQTPFQFTEAFKGYQP